MFTFFAVGAWGAGGVPGVSAHSVELVVTQFDSSSVIELDACPILGDATYGDSWGDARSGGRRHEGVDMEAERGTPVLAVRDGDAEFKQSRLGGKSIWLITDTGERFFYAHLDAWEGSSRTVDAGEVIGYVGQTGNARGNHLHFETRLGDTAVNPYPSVRASCTVEPPKPAAPTVDRQAARLR
jgi:peptidoglycan LD-endopeptidase LytH